MGLGASSSSACDGRAACVRRGAGPAERRRRGPHGPTSDHRPGAFCRGQQRRASPVRRRSPAARSAERPRAPRRHRARARPRPGEVPSGRPSPAPRRTPRSAARARSGRPAASRTEPSTALAIVTSADRVEVLGEGDALVRRGHARRPGRRGRAGPRPASTAPTARDWSLRRQPGRDLGPVGRPRRPPRSAPAGRGPSTSATQQRQAAAREVAGASSGGRRPPGAGSASSSRSTATRAHGDRRSAARRGPPAPHRSPRVRPDGTISCRVRLGLVEPANR